MPKRWDGKGGRYCEATGVPNDEVGSGRGNWVPTDDLGDGRGDEELKQWDGRGERSTRGQNDEMGGTGSPNDEAGATGSSNDIV